ncbi:putative pumilio homolog 8, chloroplastic [Brassica napus]|uniref:(rape) hypothetical protein n=1 Tax=Brassica napus TaxID=3708 RepID=A0A816YM25_BRANA|nr:putative pumilio homolog 8, chloroplastic [Brassica napus]CAF2162150.1 unnamed protein product [Brassica napus]
MMKRSEFGEEASSLSRSPSSHKQTSWNHYSLFPRDSSSSSSYFSNGLCSSEDGSSHFASHPFDRNLKMKHYNSSVVADSDEYNDLGLCESLHRLNIRDKDKEDKTCHHSFGVSSDFSVDKATLVPNFHSYGESSCNIGYNMAEMTLSTDIFMVSSPNKSMLELNSHHSVPSYSRRKGGNTNYPSLPKTSGIEGYVYLMAKDQHGCRSLQRILEYGTCLDSMIIFNEVIPHVVEVMTDPFGNYLMQKILDVCNEEQRMQILLIVTAQPGWLVQISLNTYGTRVVQRLVETVKTKKQIFLVKSALRLGFLSLVRDVNGNHVIQRCLQCLSTQDNEFIFEDATRFCIDMATHQHGCCVLQKCIAYSTGQQREKLIAEVSRNSLFLAKDPYGNYAVQFVIHLRDLSAIAMVLAQLKRHYVELSMQKFSSHTVERCLRNCPESRPQIVRELVSVPYFDVLIQDPYANFVIQAALSVTKGSLHNTLVKVIRPYSILRNNPYCKRIFSRTRLRN